jgi:16S rRNA processing protein RimM
VLVLVGRAAGAHGVRGELRLTAYTEDPEALIAYSPLLNERGETALELISGRAKGTTLIARAKGFDNRDQAEALRGLALYVPRARLPAPEEDEYYLTDLIGLEARAPEGGVIGRIKSVQNFGAGDLLEIDPADGGVTWWAPFTREGVPEVDIAGGFVVISSPEG